MSLGRKRMAGSKLIHPDSIKEIIELRKEIVRHIKGAAINPSQYIDFNWSDFEDQWDDKLTKFKQWQ